MSVNIQRRSILRGKTVAASAVRMPWLNEQKGFTELCTRCGACEKSCSQQIIKPGDGGFPVVDFSIGECTFCKQCAGACDEKLFDLKQITPWGLKAEVSGNCLNSQSVYCRSCAESCEIEAIKFNFTTNTFATPVVVLDDCTGCGACVSTCPTKAISVKKL